MVGDREFDCIGASYFGIPTVGVLYGYGTKEELAASGAVKLAADTTELLHVLKEL